MALRIKPDAKPEDLFHSHSFAKAAFGSNLGSASSVSGSGRAGDGNVGAIKQYRYATVAHAPRVDAAKRETAPSNKMNSRLTLHVDDRDKKAAASNRYNSMPSVPTFREPQRRPHNPYV